MAEIREDTKTKIRNWPINFRLKNILSRAADAAGILVVRVTSGGQPPKGSGGKRTGSTRHDHGNAADLQLLIDGHRALDFTDADDLPVIEAFVTAAAANGANGIGAGVDYMGSKTLHIGFGTSPSDLSTLVWGAGGLSGNAPKWLKKAAKKGWDAPATSFVVLAADPPGIGRFRVVARRGVRLRGGPGLGFGVISTLDPGTEVIVGSFDGPERDWARVDLEADGLFDGHVYAAFLEPSGSAPLDNVVMEMGTAASEEVEEPDDSDA